MAGGVMAGGVMAGGVMKDNSGGPGGSRVPAPSMADALRTWLQIGLLSFGGPTAQIALMHRVVVDERRWLTEQQFLNALSFCMLLPGPEAMQLATYTGWRLHGVKGGLAAGLLFVLPGAGVVLALSAVYAGFGSVPLVEGVFFGIKAAVLVIVIEALLRIARRALRGWEHWAIAGLSFLAIFVFALPFPLIIFAVGLYGFVFQPQRLEGASAEVLTIKGHLGPSLRTAAIWAAVWIGPLAVLFAVVGGGHVLTDLAWFFSKLAVVTFGGAYAVLAYMGQDVVGHFGWLAAGEMIDGLGLAETTPGPLILVTEFVGYLAAYRHGGGVAWLDGLAGAAVVLWATFAPCFLWIFVGAPYIDWINAQPRLRGALAAVTAAVVGVILNLALWFALHVFFGTVAQVQAGPARFWLPDISTLDWQVAVLAGISGLLLLWRHWSVAGVLAVAALLALGLTAAGL